MRAMRLLLRLGLLLSLLPVLPAAARADAGHADASRAVTAHARVRLLADVAQVAPGRDFTLGLRLRLAAGWHIYWRNPGAAGEPPRWAPVLPAGASAGPVAWPAPRAIHEGPLLAYAYTGTVLLTRRIRPPATAPAGSGGLTVTTHARWLICKTICVPEQARLRLVLPWVGSTGGPGGAPAPSAAASWFAAAAAALPRPSPWAATIAPDGLLWLHGPGLDPAAVVAARFFPATPGQLRNAAPQPLTRGDGLILRLTPAAGFAPAQALRGVLELTDRTGARTALAIVATPGPLHGPLARPLARPLAGPLARNAPPTAPASALWALLGFGFLGGLILNLMPCVFPVLALKAMALAGAGGGANARVRALALSYAAGVLAAFTALGLALLVARAAGYGLGWGFQFASPAAVGAMALVLFAVGLNLSGVFQAGGSAGLVQGVGQGVIARGGHVGSFFTGLLAVVVASPCTAPFMAAAVGGALAAPGIVAVGVFLALGAGLAAPVLALAAIPALGRRLPRPGAWMVRLRQVLAFPMYGAAVWLVWVVSTEAGSPGVAAMGAALVAIGFAAWSLGLAQQGGRVGFALAGAGALAALAALGWIAVTPPAAARAAPASGMAFSAARLARLRAVGRPVFVDVTARWCLTCQVNERLALDTPTTRAAFAARHVAVLVADWTAQPAAITRYLRAHGRDGVPLYVFYAPGAPHGRLLPQLLTPGLVQHAIERASGAMHG